MKGVLKQSVGICHGTYGSTYRPVDPYGWNSVLTDPYSYSNTPTDNVNLWDHEDIPYYVRASVVESHIRVQWIYDGNTINLQEYKIFRQCNEEQPNIREFSVPFNPLRYWDSYDDYSDLVMGRTYRYYIQPYSSTDPLTHTSAGVEIVFNPSDHNSQTLYAFSNSVAPLSAPTNGLYQITLNYTVGSGSNSKTTRSLNSNVSDMNVQWELVDSMDEHFDITSFNVANHSSNGTSESFVIAVDSSRSGILNLSLSTTDSIALGDSIIVSSQINPVNQAVLKMLSNSLDMGETPLGTSVTDSFTIYNIGNIAMQVSPQYVGSPNIHVPTGSVTVPPSGQATVEISFHPTDTLPSFGQIILNHNGASSPDTISVMGHGTRTVTHGYSVMRHWNLVSVPLVVEDGSKAGLFPSAISIAFAYEGTYVQKDTLQPGIGYWLKFPDSQAVPITGIPVARETLDVSEGWNLIGSIGDSLSVYSISSIPTAMITSQFYGYDGHYFTTDVLVPSRGYWVKVTRLGKLILALSGSNLGTNRIRIISNSELPPPPPEGVLNRNLPSKFALEQNYPNPFNPTTTIKYQLPYDSKVSLKIYNVLGQTIVNLVDDFEQAGYKSVEWNANNLASGVYFYRLDATTVAPPANPFVQVKKILLLR